MRSSGAPWSEPSVPPLEAAAARPSALPATTPRRPAGAPAPTGAEVVLGILGKTATVTQSVVVRVPGTAALSRLPLPSPLSRALRSGWLRAGLRGRADGAAVVDLLQRAADVLVPRLVREVLSRLDVAALVREYVDLDRIAELLDVDAVIARADLDRAVGRVDLDAVIDRVDVERVVDRVDLDAIVDRVDLQRVVDRLDLDAIVERVDLDAIAARLDLDAIIDRLDLDRAAARLDLDAIIDRLDLIGLAEDVVTGVDLPGIIRSSTGSMTSEVVSGVRAQGAGADRAVERLVDRLLLRHQERRTALAPGDGGPAAEAPGPAG